MSRAHLFPHFRVVDAGPRVGKGRDTRVGIMEARGRCRLYMDADLATPLRYIDDVVRLSDRGAKLGTAVRDLKSSHKGLRRLISLIGNVLVQMLLLPGVHDSQCGFKFFEAGVAEELFGRQTVLGWGFDMEILAIARLRGHRIETIEAPDWLDVPGGSFHQSAVRGTIETLRDLFAIKLKLLFGRYRRPTFVYEAFRPGEVASVSAVPAPRVAR
jgi:dolichyl-phosphate beta-glucosyltransferase